MSDPTLFLDIDGVLNGHDYNERAQSNLILPGCVEQLNRVIGQTGCEIVLSSAWRYMILKGAMTVGGFSYLLRTHGVDIGVRGGAKLIGVLPEDTGREDPEERADLIRSWIVDHKTIRWAIVDDLPMNPDCLHGFVRTDPVKGLTEADANTLISILRGRDA